MKLLRVYGVMCVLILVAAAAVHATTIVMPTDAQLIAKSRVIVEGTVVSTSPVDHGGSIWTDTVVDVTRVLKGRPEATITVHEIGGEIDGRFTKIFGAPEYQPGQHVLLFLDIAPTGGYRTMDLFVGKFTDGVTLDGRRLWLRDDIGAQATLLDSKFEPVTARNVQREAPAFERYVRDRVAGREGVANYGIENPVLARDVDTSGGSGNGRISANFTMISEPTIYRWRQFDSGTTAQWYSSGTQPGYVGGGVNELQTAMGAWTGYSAAKILYNYAGSRGGSMGGLSNPNGINEVLFNDPLNEIAGSWNGSSGVVGQGGFNGVSGSASWTSPFDAGDGTHTQRTWTAYTITEGNLVVQDAVSPSAGISSSRLAEIVAHEFGHTLGFGHSADSTALMYAYVTGRGPTLKADDQLAAQWLYPNGGGSPPPPPQPPASPTNLYGAAFGSTAIDLQWHDNASNETGQSVYLAVGAGSFTKVTDVGANVTSTRLSGLAAGTYRVYVTAWNSAGSSGASNTVSVTLASSSSLTAAFSFTPSSGTAGTTTFTFTDQSSGTVSSRAWNFGDGTTSNATAPSHVYANPGQYTVTLTVSNSSTSSQTSKTVSVNAPLQSAFVFSPSNPAVGTGVSFMDNSTGGVTAWSWNFGDGTSSSMQNPVKSYSASGSYTVRLTVMRNAESSTSQQVVTVSPSAPITPPVTASFNVSATTAAVGANVSFYDASTGSPTSWSWTFGDGAVSYDRNPVHAWSAPGTYTVTMAAWNATSTSTYSRDITVTSVAPFRSLVAVIAQTSGLSNTSWRTELSLFNSGSNAASVSLIFIPSAGGSVLTRNLFLSPRQSVTYANTLLDLFGLSTGAGALAIEATSAGSAAALTVSSRTFTTGDAGTYGQSVPDVGALDRTLYVSGIISNSLFRTNIGLVNRGGTPVAATLTLYDANGSTVGVANLTLPASNFQQAPLSSFFPQVSGGSYDALTMRLTAATSDAVSAYASVVDNRTQDPVYVQAVPPTSAASITLPIVGRANGANGTFWRSDVTFYNPSGSRQYLTLRYAGMSKTLSLAAGETRILADIVLQFGRSSGTGTLVVDWSSGSAPVVTSRTYTNVAAGGTYGQSIDPIAKFATSMFVPGLRNDATYRTNIGFVNGGTEAEVFRVSLLSEFGTEIASTTLGLQPNEQSQTSISSLFPGVATAGTFTLAITGDSNARLFAYGSIVDNESGDPVFYAGR